MDHGTLERQDHERAVGQDTLLPRLHTDAAMLVSTR